MEKWMVSYIVKNKKRKHIFLWPIFILCKDNAPKNIGTWDRSQPLVYAISCYYIFKNSKDKPKSKEFLTKIYPKV